MYHCILKIVIFSNGARIDERKTHHYWFPLMIIGFCCGERERERERERARTMQTLGIRQWGGES